MARGFPVLADNHVQQAVVEGLLTEGWDVMRAIDVFPEGTDDEVLFGHTVKAGRIFVTNDEDLLAIGQDWLREREPLSRTRLLARTGLRRHDDGGHPARLRQPRCEGKALRLPDPIRHPSRNPHRAPGAFQEITP